MSTAGSGIGATRRAIVIFQQNMALLPELRMPNGKKLYLGREREAALDCLAYFLLEYLPDLVGLSEMWVGGGEALAAGEIRPLLPLFPGRTG